MTARAWAVRFAIMASTLVAIVALTSCEARVIFAPICRGDSTAATADTSLVRCSTLDSLARR